MARVLALSVCTAVLGLFLGGCSDEGSTSGSGAGGAGGTGSSTAGPSGSTSSTSGPTASSAGAGGGGGQGGGSGGGSGSAFKCDPPAAPGSIYELSGESLNVEEVDPISMCKYRGEVMLVVNTAAVCGYTPQMEGLQSLEEKFAGQGLRVLGFLSNDFGNQGGSEEDIDSCTDKYKVTFEQFAIDHVKGADAQPVFNWILSHPNPGPSSALEPTWNFHKYLISRDGKLIASWDTETYPGDDPSDANDSFDANPIVMKIKEELAK